MSNCVVWRTSAERLTARLADVGFSQIGSGRFALDGYRLEVGAVWSTLTAERAIPPASDPLVGQVGTPGPWKRVVQDGACRLIADFPSSVLREDVSSDLDSDCDDAGGPPLAPFFEWLQGTSSGGTGGRWQPPELAEIESWYGPEKLTVVSGQIVRQGTLERALGRLAVRIPIVPTIPRQLADTRRRWLSSILVDAQNRHRATRIGLMGDPPQSVVAEIDLSGAPLRALPGLFTASLAALQNTVRWSIPSADFLVDQRAACRALEVRPDPAACERPERSNPDVCRRDPYRSGRIARGDVVV